jgi:deoxyribonuclease IV
MLIGAHVSLAGGLAMAIERGSERGCRAIQIFNQSPRMWRPTAYPEEAIAAFREAMAQSPIEAAVIHTVYLLNCASSDRAIRAKSRRSLIQSLRVGEQIGARGVVLHPGSAKRGDVARAIARCGRTVREALAESERCPVHLENTAGAGGTLGRSIGELGALLEATGADKRVGVCLDSCHLFASGYDIRTAAGMDALVGEVDAELGLERLGSLHLNDSQAPLGSNRDRHANLTEGQLGERGLATFLGTPQLQELPCLLETNGPDRKGATREEITLATSLHKRGLAARRRARAPSAGSRGQKRR